MNSNNNETSRSIKIRITIDKLGDEVYALVNAPVNVPVDADIPQDNSTQYLISDN